MPNIVDTSGHPLAEGQVPTGHDGLNTPSTIWQTALEKYHEELRKGGIKGATIDKSLWDTKSAHDVLYQIDILLMRADGQTSSTWNTTLTQFERVLTSLNDFVATITLALGMNYKIVAVVWGSIRLILRFAPPAFPSVLHILEELKRSLPRFHNYEQELPVSSALEDRLLAVYTELIVFYTQTTALLCNISNIPWKSAALFPFSTNISITISNLRMHSKLVDEAADMIRLSREIRSAETMQAMKDQIVSKISTITIPCYIIPYGLNLRFFGRSTELEVLGHSLDPQPDDESLRMMAIHGLGGVGKSQLALRYANTSTKIYDFIVWIPAETQITLIRTLTTFAAKLGLPKAQDTEDDYQLIHKVRDWLNTTDKTFLFVFDNIDKVELLDQIWPVNCRGSVLITTRSPVITSEWATKVINLECFKGETAPEVLYLLNGNQPLGERDTAAAKELCELLGGFPLAMAQISEFIRDRGLSYEELLPIYKRLAEKIYARPGTPAGYTYNLTTVWDVSFRKLSLESRTLLNLLAFFDPDLIPETLLTAEKTALADLRLKFLVNEFEFGDSVIELTRTSLLKRLSSDKALSIHKLVQDFVIKRLTPSDRLFYLDSTIQILFNSFPNTWNQRGPHYGHGWESWESSSRILPHVSWLMRLTEKHELEPSNLELYAELIFRAGTYLWEKGQPTIALSFFESGLRLNINLSSPISAQAYRLLGHIALDRAQPRAALSAYKKALAVREKIEEPNSPPIADVYDSIAYSHAQMGEVSEAFDYLSKAKAIHQTHNPRFMARTQAVYAMTYLRAGQPEEALVALTECWRLQNLNKSEIVKSKYPKHSGDIALLARIKYAQGQKDEARTLASQTISIRKRHFGDKGPHVADSMFVMARMLDAGGESMLAAKLLRDIVDMSSNTLEMKGHLTRAQWFWAIAEVKIGNIEKAEELRNMAKKGKAEIDGISTVDELTDADFMNLVAWMLW